MRADEAGADAMHPGVAAAAMAVFSVVLMAAAADHASNTSYFDSILHVTESRAVVCAVVTLSNEDDDDDDCRIGVGESEADDDDDDDEDTDEVDNDI